MPADQKVEIIAAIIDIQRLCDRADLKFGVILDPVGIDHDDHRRAFGQMRVKDGLMYAVIARAAVIKADLDGMLIGQAIHPNRMLALIDIIGNPIFWRAAKQQSANDRDEIGFEHKANINCSLKNWEAAFSRLG